jgi:hypothetical protein
VVEPNTTVRLRGLTLKAKNHIANCGAEWTVKHATGSKHMGTFLVANGPRFEAMWLTKDYEVEVAD